MTPDEELITAKAGLFCALTGTKPEELLDDLITESKGIVSKLTEYLDTIECSDMARVLFIPSLKEAFKAVEQKLGAALGQKKAEEEK